MGIVTLTVETMHIIADIFPHPPEETLEPQTQNAVAISLSATLIRRVW